MHNQNANSSLRMDGNFPGGNILVERVQSGTLPYHSAHDLPYGQGWNQPVNCQQGMTFARWAGSVAGVRLSTSFELPYATAGEREVNAATARAFGADLARAIAAYLRSL